MMATVNKQKFEDLKRGQRLCDSRGRVWQVAERTGREIRVDGETSSVVRLIGVCEEDGTQDIAFAWRHIIDPETWRPLDRFGRTTTIQIS